ncbi:MAG: carboxypeptidase-like regulatory domain-containing protein [Bacteroidales bacterium]
MSKSYSIKLLSLLLIFISLMKIEVLGQQANDSIFNQRVTLPTNRNSIYHTLNQLSDSIGLLFAYESKLVESDKIIKPKISHITLRNALNQILNDTTLSYKVIDNHILIYKNKEETNGLNTKQANNTQGYKILRGYVLDSQTQQPLSYVTIGLPEIAMGTTTNLDGAFILKIPKATQATNLLISHIGYKTKKIPITLFAQSAISIFLETDIISIQEVIIRNIDPKQLITDALQKIQDNYSRVPVYYTSFYREGVVKNKKYQNYSEAIFKIYKSPIQKQFESDQVRLIKSRKTQNLEPTDTLSIKLKGGIHSSLALDIVKNIPSFLDESYWNKYTFKRSDMVSIDGITAFAISFNLKEGVTDPLLEGVIYIDVNSLAILGADLNISPANITQVTDMFVHKRNRQFKFKPVSISYSVRYTSINGTHYLSHVRGDLRFKYRFRRNLFNSSFHLFFELLNTQIDTSDVARFNRKDTEPIQKVFLDNSYQYDQTFWDDQNIIPPEKSIYEGLKDIKTKIEEIESE